VITGGSNSSSTLTSLLDAQYFFGAQQGKSFRGFSVRNRYIRRNQNAVAQFGGLPLLVYNRLQFDYTW
jgi:hypothetical protein